MRLVDADIIEKIFEDEGFNYCALVVWTMPTIDAVEVVRCKDCKHFDGSYPMCCRFEETVKADDYCSFGEKTEVEE